MLMEVPDRPAVRNKMSLKAPVLTQDFLQRRTSAAWLSVCPVVSAHDRFYACFLHKRLKCRKVGLLHILRRRLGVKLMSERLRSGVHRKMLRTCRRLQGISISLQAFYKRHTKTACQIRILSICLMTAPPARIAENVDIRRPEGQSLVNITVVFGRAGIVFCTSLCRNHICLLL